MVFHIDIGRNDQKPETGAAQQRIVCEADVSMACVAEYAEAGKDEPLRKFTCAGMVFHIDIGRNDQKPETGAAQQRIVCEADVSMACVAEYAEAENHEPLRKFTCAGVSLSI